MIISWISMCTFNMPATGMFRLYKIRGCKNFLRPVGVEEVIFPH
jgi:hypothetical protein